MSPQLPLGLRRVTLGALALAAIVGFGAAQSLAVLLEPPTLDPQAMAMWGADAAPYKDAVKAMFDAQMSAYESMRTSRGLILFGLSVAATLALVAAVQLIWAAGTPRELLRQRLAGAMLIAAVLRTLEGAQSSAVAGRAGAAFDRVLLKSNEIPGGWPQGLAETGCTAVMMGMSLLVCGALLALALYFRSERVRKTVGTLDAQPPQEP